MERITMTSEVSQKQIDDAARKAALSIQALMAVVEEGFNDHVRCIVCNHQYKQHIDSKPCVDDDNVKQIVRKSRWRKDRIIK
tara:strand:- start:764 stop:1009 length:246 start_codon:yes stop_codon:yes gene_type:complete